MDSTLGWLARVLLCLYVALLPLVYLSYRQKLAMISLLANNAITS